MLLLREARGGAGACAHPIESIRVSDSAVIHPPTILPVCLNGERDYVQGTQMIARSAEILEECFGIEPVLYTAAFHKITDHQVAVCTDESDLDEAAALGDMLFTLDRDRTAKLFLIELPQTAPREVVPVGCRYEFIETVGEDLRHAIFQISEIGGGEDLLVALVQSLKSLHETAFPGASNIWFTGLRDGKIPMGTTLAGLGSCRLELRIIRRLPGRVGWQSMTTATVLDDDDERRAEAVMSFAFKSADGR